MKYSTLLKQKFSEHEVLIAAHQGLGGGNIVLNSKNAMINAIRHGADLVELDVSKSKDGVFFAFHQDQEIRHLMSIKKIEQMTAEEIKNLYFYTNAMTESAFRVQTLKEMMMFLKTQDVLVNLDKCDLFDGDLFLHVDEFGMEEQVLLKGTCTKEFLDMVAAHPTKYMFMPLIKSEADMELVMSYGEAINVVGFELIFDDVALAHVQKDYMQNLRENGFFLWVNAISLGKNFCLSADIDDDIAMLEDPDAGWGRLVEMGFNVLQTDFASDLRYYRNEKGW